MSLALGTWLGLGAAIGAPGQQGRADGAGGTLDARLVEQLHAAIASCWLMPPEAARAGAAVRLRLSLHRDGSLDGEPVVLDADDGPLFRALAASAIRAVKRCAPYAALARHGESYERWRRIVLSFKPSF